MFTSLFLVGAMSQLSMGLTVGCVVLGMIVVALAIGMIVTAHNKLNAEQMELISDAQAFHDVGANKIASLLSELACLNMRRAIKRLKMFLTGVRNPKDALNLFEEMWFFQLKMRMEDEGQKKKIMDFVTAAMQAEIKGTLAVVETSVTQPKLKQEASTKIVP